jgi:esterase
MPDIHLPRIRLYYEESGSGDPILCIHGTSSSAMVWGAATSELSQLGRVIVYDRRGCHRSERPVPYATTSVSEHADDAASLLQALGAVPAVVIGRSYGGEIATDLALRYPGAVRALVLLEGAPPALSAAAKRWEDEVTRATQAVAATRGVEAVAESFLRSVLGDAAWDQFPDETKRMFTGNSPAILAEMAGGNLLVDARTLAGITQPTLLVAAEDSPEAFREATEAMALALPDARTVLIGGGHLINPADPAVLSFLKENMGRSGEA